MGRSTAAIQGAWLLSQGPHAAWAKLAALAPERALSRRFASLMAVLGPTAQGRDLGLSGLSFQGWPGSVPLRGWSEHSPYIDRVCDGEPGVITTETVDVVEPTGGSTGGTKLIPSTPRLRGEFSRAVGAWMVDLHAHVPGLWGTQSYWSVSRATKAPATTAGGLPIGLPDDSAYLGPASRWALSRLFAVGSEVSRAPTLDDWRRQTLSALVEAHDLGMISVWSPTFLGRLLDALVTEDLPGLSASAARRLSASRESGLDVGVLWPRLQGVSCWTHGFAAPLAEALQKRLGAVPIWPKGLLATEGVVSVPLGDGDPVVLPVHLIELVEVGTGRACWPHQVELGGRYQPVLTTGGGLVRYPLPDELVVTGFWGRLPRVRLLGRLDKGSDLVGEKLTAAFVNRVLSSHQGFAMLVPDGLSYVLVVDRDPPDPRFLDERLREAYHYAYARDLGQLGEARVRVVDDAWGRWERGCEAAGLSLGGQKPDGLETRPPIVKALLEER